MIAVVNRFDEDTRPCTDSDTLAAWAVSIRGMSHSAGHARRIKERHVCHAAKSENESGHQDRYGLKENNVLGRSPDDEDDDDDDASYRSGDGN
jgi:hypothetical protein